MTPKPSRHRRAWRDKQAYAKLDAAYERQIEKKERNEVAHEAAVQIAAIVYVQSE